MSYEYRQHREPVLVSFFSEDSTVGRRAELRLDPSAVRKRLYTQGTSDNYLVL